MVLKKTLNRRPLTFGVGVGVGNNSGNLGLETPEVCIRILKIRNVVGDRVMDRSR